MSERTLKIILPIGILLVGALIAVVMIKSRAPVKTRPSSEYAPLVRVVETQPGTHQLVVRTHGTVTPRTESSLVSEVSGQVVDIAPSFASGGFFEKGDVLLKIDPRDYELAVITARGQVAQARVRLETEEAQARVAREEWKELGNGENSPLATRELQVQEARAALAAAEAALERAQRNLKRTRIRAPFAGRVREKNVDVGQYVLPGIPVATIYAVDFAEVRLPIPDAELAFLDLPVDYHNSSSSSAGPQVRLYADFAGERRMWQGQIVRVEGEIDPVSRMVHAVAQIDDPYGRDHSDKQQPLAVGLFVEAEIIGREVDNAVLLPRNALRANNTVLVVDDNDRLRFRSVDVLRIDRESVIIGSGLDRGERVCISNLQAVTDGMKVRTSGVSGTPTKEADEVGDET
ncbi:MAG: efflux RND transporter periplasmic adaptor subunit [Candidatus Latescibacteria bacterium]|nr:efflux RND transporter periplasmic adaptor subunit [Candidatus Latescibacterota bacterium]NIO56196.1 efflux RND transporter periplasmic adaptor subunit [Candidatus Latescibacterota bacterium]